MLRVALAELPSMEDLPEEPEVQPRQVLELLAASVNLELAIISLGHWLNMAAAAAAELTQIQRFKHRHREMQMVVVAPAGMHRQVQ